ncbi:MAG: hypothetical protein JWN01_608 [Patescibacteria group bacterium]|nr:hypothetical protein [Patescibacteria group bacterium]
MGHLADSELQSRLAQAASQVSIGAEYVHYKGNIYLVTGLAILEATDEVGIIYDARYGEGLTFVRALESWLETVEYKGENVPRFARRR